MLTIRKSARASTLTVAVGLFTAFSLLPGMSTAEGITTVSVTGGEVQGIPSDTAGVMEFRGIPFAGNVGGENRWKIAPPVEPWEGVLVADTWGDQMLQDYDPEGTDPVASDDGLNLTVWTPAESPDANLPVYMLIHGGANRLGSAAMGSLYAAELAAKGIVVVSVQYRLGAQGFMALPGMAEENPDGPKGNFGVLDLVTALHWIQDNVTEFGGDPTQVTIGGQSAGGENAVALLRTPLADGLFQRAFIQSSFTGFLPGKVVPFEEKSVNNQAAVEEIFGRPMTLDDLRAIDAETWLSDVEGSNQSLYTALGRATASSQFYTIDDYVYTDDSVNLLQPGDFDGLDIMIGQTADEYTGLRSANGSMTDAEQRDALLSSIRSYQVGDVDEGVLPLYATDDAEEAYRLSLRMVNDFMFQYVKVGAEIAEARNDANVYLYYWDHWPPGADQGFRRAYHGADNRYFNASLREGADDQRVWTDPDLRMKDIASTYLANFVKTGDPNGHDVPHWGQTRADEGAHFMRFHEGDARMVSTTIFPSRDEYQRAQILEGMGITEADF